MGQWLARRARREETELVNSVFDLEVALRHAMSGYRRLEVCERAKDARGILPALMSSDRHACHRPGLFRERPHRGETLVHR